ncbi:hypothetical protein BC332_34158 [Capsicum chinense]|nr:hypothetical protein BC332_34158 [Capsicum chinense]
MLITMLREKLYSEEMDIKQLQADLAVTVRVTRRGFGKFALSSDLILGQAHELSTVLKRDKNINKLTNDLQECMKELGVGPSSSKS